MLQCVPTLIWGSWFQQTGAILLGVGMEDEEGMEELLGAEKCSPNLAGSGGRLLSESKRNALGNASCWGSLSQLAAPANQDCVLSGVRKRLGAAPELGLVLAQREDTPERAHPPSQTCAARFTLVFGCWSQVEMPSKCCFSSGNSA